MLLIFSDYLRVYNVLIYDPIIRVFQEEISVSTGSSFLARLLSVGLACLILIGLGVLAPSHADAGCRLAGVEITANQNGEWVVLSVEGTPEYQVVPLEHNNGLAIVLADCELVDGFQLPSLEPGSAISRIEYRLTLLAGTQSVELTIHMEEGLYEGYNVDTSEPGVLKLGLAPEVEVPVVEPEPEPPSEVVEDVEVMWYGPREGDPDAIFRIETIDVVVSGETEEVKITLDKPAEPEIRKFSYPNRVVFELDGGYLAEDVDEYLYTSRDGVVTKVDILFSPQHLAGVFQLIISCPEMGSYGITENGTEYVISISRETSEPVIVMETPAETSAIEPAATSTEDVAEEEAVSEVEEPVTEELTTEETPAEEMITPEGPVEVETAGYPTAPPPGLETMNTGSQGPAVGGPTTFYEYPSVPISDEDSEEGGYNFPEPEESLDPNHVSDAIVSLNVTNADFQAVMMILAEQAGVNFVLDAYWRTTPSGYVRENFRPPGGPDPSGGGGGFGGGSNWNPRDGGGGGSVTMHLSEVPFDTAFGMLMQAHNLRFTVFRYTEDTDPILFISSRERIEQELNLGTIQIYHLHYIDSGAAFDFLRSMDLLPSTSGYGIWEYQGGGGGNNSGGSGGSGGYGGGGGRGGGYSANPPGAFSTAIGGTPIVDYSNYTNSYGLTRPDQMQSFGGGSSGGGGGGGGGGTGGGGGGTGGGGGGGGGGGQIPTAKGGAIGIIATEETHDKIREALMHVDKPPKMIFVEATFITYDDTNPEGRPIEYGLQNIGDWALEFGGDRFYGAFDATGSEGLVFEILPKNQRMPFDDFRARFHYLFSDRNAKIISSPRVAVIDGFTATINVTENRPFIVDGGVIIDQFGNPIPAPDIVTFVPTGTTLTITPYIDDYGNVTMAMSPTNTSMLGEPTLINGNLVFGTANASISTVLRMRDGETIILGGLKVKNRDYRTNRLPILGDIPFIGALFGTTEINITENQLIILMTVHLVGS